MNNNIEPKYDVNKIKTLEHKYINKLENLWKKIIKNKYKKYYFSLLSLTHLTGIHLDFYHKPYLFMNKKYPELLFRNAMFKKIVKLNKLLYKEIFLPQESINLMIDQCDYIITNKDYWKRHGYSEFQINIIDETYILFKNYLLDYIKYLEVNKFKFNKDIDGLGKTKLGENIFSFILRYNSGDLNISVKNIQGYALLKYHKLKKQIEAHTKKPFLEALKYAQNLEEKYTSMNNFMSDAKLNIFKLEKNTEKLFDKTILIPYAEKIAVKPIPVLRAKWTTDSKAQKSTVFLNTENWNNISKNQLMRICAHESLPGHILERYNSNKVFNNYKISSKIKKYMKHGFTSSTEGWAYYSESLSKDLYSQDKILVDLINQLNISIKMIVDIGLNSKKGHMKFTTDMAFKFIKYHTQDTDENIKKEILRYLVKPGEMACSGYGYFNIKKLKEISNLDNITFNSLYCKIPLSLPLMKEFMYEVKN